MSSSPRPIISILWKTPVATQKSETPLERAPLLAYPLVLERVLKLLNFWDVMKLVATGHAEFTVSVRLRARTLRIFNQDGPQRRTQPKFNHVLAFQQILRLPHLTSLSIISPAWMVPKTLTRSPLQDLPPTMRHLTVWTSDQTKHNLQMFSKFVLLDYASLYPKLQTLRLCSTVATNYLVDLRPFVETMIPTDIRTLSLLGFVNIDDSLCYRICQPIVPTSKRNDPIESDSHSSTETAPRTAVECLTPASPSNRIYHFPCIEFLEWGGVEIGFNITERIWKAVTDPRPADFPPLLHTYIRSSRNVLSPLPSRSALRRREDANRNAIERTSLQTFRFASCGVNILENEYRPISSSLTELQLGSHVRCRRQFLQFESLRTFITDKALDALFPLPDTITSLSADSGMHRFEYLFGDFEPLVSLRNLSLRASLPGILMSSFPSSLTSLNLTLLRPLQVLRYPLPSGLRSLYLELPYFSNSFFEHLPRGLEDLTVKGGIATNEMFRYQFPSDPMPTPVDCDISDLPPSLTRLRLLCYRSHFVNARKSLLFPAAQLAQLPRTLKHLELYPVYFVPSTYSNDQKSNVKSKATTRTGRKANSIKSFFGKFGKLLSLSRPSSKTVSVETVKEALSGLPEDCWCNIQFVFMTRDEKDRSKLKWFETPSLQTLISSQLESSTKLYKYLKAI